MLIEIFSTLIVSYLTYSWIIYPIYFSPLRNVPGPPIDYFLVKNFITNILTSYSSRVDQTELVNKYGGIVKLHGLFNKPDLIVADEKALQKILSSGASDFNKPKGFLNVIEPILGNGLLIAEGEEHKKQRKLMNTVFYHSNVKEMVSSFIKVGNTVKKLWKNEIKNNHNNDDVEKKRAKINIQSYMSKAALDTIGLVGFDYEFNSLTTSSKLSHAYESFFNSKSHLVYRLLSKKFPILELLPVKGFRDTKETARVIEEVTTELVNEKLDQFAKGELNNKNDLLSCLIRANSEYDLNEDEKFKFVDLKNQIMTFLFAGHETTAVTLTWALYYLSKDLEVQNKLRKEIVKVFPDKDSVPTTEQINSLEYLNAVCKETLRLSPPGPLTLRVPNKDTIINGYLVPKGTLIFVPVFTVQHLESTWGPDVREFKPSRWFDEHTIKTVTNYNYLPFMTGTRSCIGINVALNEIKTILAILLRNFEFHEIEGLEIKKGFDFIYKLNPSFSLWVNEIDN